jgi:hypothetical protein
MQRRLTLAMVGQQIRTTESPNCNVGGWVTRSRRRLFQHGFCYITSLPTQRFPYRYVPRLPYHNVAQYQKLNNSFGGVTNTGCTGLGGAALAHTGLSFVPSGPASSSFL